MASSTCAGKGEATQTGKGKVKHQGNRKEEKDKSKDTDDRHRRMAEDKSRHTQAKANVKPRSTPPTTTHAMNSTWRQWKSIRRAQWRAQLFLQRGRQIEEQQCGGRSQRSLEVFAASRLAQLPTISPQSQTVFLIPTVVHAVAQCQDEVFGLPISVALSVLATGNTSSFQERYRARGTSQQIRYDLHDEKNELGPYRKDTARLPSTVMQPSKIALCRLKCSSCRL